MKNNDEIQKFVDGLLVFNTQKQIVNDVDELAWRIWKILTEEKRLARRPDAKFKQAILDKIKGSIAVGKPIIMIDAFGGFKNYRSPTFPHVDWSEVFMLNKLVKQCVKIAAVYEPGVKLEFSGDSEMLTFFDNYPKDAIDTYRTEFCQLLAIFQKHVPTNVQLSYKGLADFYDLPKLEKRIVKIADAMAPEEVEQLFKKNRSKAKNNFMVNGVVDYSSASKSEFEAALCRSVVLDHLYIEIDIAERAEYLEGGLHLPLIQTAIPGCIALKSVNTSKLAFWLGTGYLRMQNGGWIPYIQHGQKWQQLQGVEYEGVDSPFSVVPGLDKMPYIPEAKSAELSAAAANQATS
jgi:hypothetical protein